MLALMTGLKGKLCCCLSLLVLLQCKDRRDVLALVMRRHPSWPGAGRQAAAARPGELGREAATPAADSPPAMDTQDGNSDSDSAGSVGISEDAHDDMHDEFMSAEAAAAATATPRTGRPRTYTAEEQAVMRDLNLNSLTNVVRDEQTPGTVRWRVKLHAEGLRNLAGGCGVG